MSKSEYGINYVSLCRRLFDWNHTTKSIAAVSQKFSDTAKAEAVYSLACSFQDTFGLTGKKQFNTEITKDTTVSYGDFSKWINMVLEVAKVPLNYDEYEMTDDLEDAEMRRSAKIEVIETVQKLFVDAKLRYETVK